MRIKILADNIGSCAKMSDFENCNGVPCVTNSDECKILDKTCEENLCSEPTLSPSCKGVSDLKHQTKLKILNNITESADVECTSKPSEASASNSSSLGGRLKFFKDGKFILELSHRKEGDKTTWIPVPKKSYWPIDGGSSRQDSLASLSVSDDNSSVQSSPWQRDHGWKQPNPCRNINKQLQFFLVFPKSMRYLRNSTSSCIRRNPSYNIIIDKAPLKNIRRRSKKRPPLKEAVEMLWENASSINKVECGTVSPRKRILKELEKVSLEESKRQRARTPARRVNSHSISAILGQEDDSVLRTLLRSPSPDRFRLPRLVGPSVSSSVFPGHGYFQGHLYQGLWPPLYSSSPSHVLPGQQASFPTPSQSVPPSTTTPTATYLHHSAQPPLELSTDLPLNLSKNAG